MPDYTGRHASWLIAGFLDLRPAIRVATAQEVLHGPRDFKHFNRKGYEVLGRSVAERFDSPLVAQECAEISVGLDAQLN